GSPSSITSVSFAGTGAPSPASGAVKVQTSSNAEWFFFIDQGRPLVRLRENRQSTRETRIASLTFIYQPGLTARLLYDAFRRKAQSAMPARSLAASAGAVPDPAGASPVLIGPARASQAVDLP